MSEHRKTKGLPRDDLVTDPGIGRRKGTTIAGADPEETSGENTDEGHVMNDMTPQGGADPNQRGRTNR